jgi:hypothetical protein
MSLRRPLFGVIWLLVALVGFAAIGRTFERDNFLGRAANAELRHSPQSPSSQSARDSTFRCPVTRPNGVRYTAYPAGGNHGNEALVTVLWPEGKVVFEPGGAGFVLEDGSLSMKWMWWRKVPGRLVIEGRRLDGSAPPLRARIPNGYGENGFQATALIFPTPGCWEVTGQVGDASLTFVTLVVKIGDGPGRPRSR